MQIVKIYLIYEKDGQEYIRFVKMKAQGKFWLPLTKEMKTLTSQTYFPVDRP